MNYSIHIIEDEYSGRTAISILLRKVFSLHIGSMTASRTFEEAEADLKQNRYDILFIDINLNGRSAFDLVHLIPPSSKIIFVTAYTEHMLNAIRVRAFDYLVKPINEDELSACLDRIMLEAPPEVGGQHLCFRNRGITTKIRQADIIYIKGNGPYSSIHTLNETYIISKTLKNITQELDRKFIRIHKTYVVNSAFIKGYNKQKIILINDQCLPVSRSGSKNISSSWSP